MAVPRLFALLLLAGCTATVPPREALRAAEPVYELANGRWWDGERFVEGSRFVGGGVFVEPPSRVDRVVDLGGRWVVPPYGDAHAHHFETPSLVERIGSMYLEHGIFYGMSLTNWSHLRPQVAPYYARRETLDVAWSDAGITGPYGHPILVYESLARNRFDFNPDSIRPWSDRRAEGRAYFIADSEAQLDSIWPRVVESRPDILKIFLVESERHDENRRDTTRLAHVGLRPSLVAPAVRLAHAEGLRVAAHVETVADVRLALAAGVDVLAHLPSYHLAENPAESELQLTDRDGRQMAAAGMVAIAGPMAGVEAYAPDSSRHRRALALQRHNLGMLRRHGVAVAIGSDRYMTSAVPEAAHLHRLGVYTPAELLRIWSETTPRAIFPARRIGRLAPGYEASLLVLSCDPLERWECTGEIRLRLKEGAWIEIPRPEP
jgi:hypothetical protein